MKSKLFLLVVVLAVFFICGITYAEDTEEIVLTTYYPAPYGDYDGLSANSMAIGPTYAIPTTSGNLVVEGNLGIGTTTPTSALDVNGTAQVNYLVVDPQDTISEGGEIRLEGAASFADWQLDNLSGRFRLHSGGSERLTVTTAGNVGIGTTGPGAKLDVAGDIQIGVNNKIGARLASTGSNGYVIPYDTNGRTVIWNTYPSSQGILFGTNNSERMRIDQIGNVGIGTTAPLAKLDVNGEARVWRVFQINPYTNNISEIRAGAPNSSTSGHLQISNLNGDNKFRLWTDTGIAHAHSVWVDNAFDLAEDYPLSAGVKAEEGDIIAVDKTNPPQVKIADTPYASEIIGIYSNHVAQLSKAFEAEGKEGLPGYIPVALIGRVPTKVSTENGPINVGDFITSSSQPGMGMKATQPGMVVGKALEPLKKGEGKILVFVSNGWYAADSKDKVDALEQKITKLEKTIEEINKKQR